MSGVKWFVGFDRNEPVATRSDIEAALEPATEQEINRLYLEESGDQVSTHELGGYIKGYRAAQRAIRERVMGGSDGA